MNKQSSEKDEHSTSATNIFDRLYEGGTKKKETKKTLEELKLLSDLKDCTFQP